MIVTHIGQNRTLYKMLIKENEVNCIGEKAIP